MKEPLYVFDGFGMIFRAYFAFIRSPMRAPDGRNTQAVFGFFRVLLSFIKEYKPHYFAVALESRGPTFRDEIYPEYKATRDKTPDDLIVQFPIIEQVMTAMGLPLLRAEGFEADDVMATLARMCAEEQRECILVSADKDMLQLVGGTTRVLKPAREGGFTEMTRDAVKSEKGVWPEQILDYLSLLGDASDNVPGVKGVGEKTAAKLLEEHGSLDGIYSAIETIPGALKQKLADGHKSAYFSKTLITLRSDAQLGLPEGDHCSPFLVSGFNGMAAAEILRPLGIKQLADEMSRLGGSAGSSPSVAAAASGSSVPGGSLHGGSLHGGSGNLAASGDRAGNGDTSGTRTPLNDASGDRASGDRAEDRTSSDASLALDFGSEGETSGLSAAGLPPGYGIPWLDQPLRSFDAAKQNYELVTSLDRAMLWVESAKAAGIYCFDTETDGLDPHSARLAGISLAVQAGEACYIALNGPEGPVMDEAQLRDLLRPLIEDPQYRLVGHNIKFDYQIMQAWGLTMANPWFDTMIASWLCDTSAPSYSMDAMAERVLAYKTIHLADLVVGQGAKIPKGMDVRFSQIPLDAGARYSAEDADVTLQLYERLAPVLKTMELERLFFELEMPIIPILAAMEYAGMGLDPAALRSYAEELAKRLELIEDESYILAGERFNLASPKQLQEILFVKRKLKGTKRTKTGFSTDSEVLEELALEDPLPRKILEHRNLSKLKGTYVDTLPELINPRTGRIHSSLMQTGTATGRISSKDPNLQNIPIRDEDGRRIRSAFVPAPGHTLISADYSQIELVILAHLSEDPKLMQAFTQNIDVHRSTGSLIFGVEPEAVTAQQRRIAKTINFGVMYGMGAFRLARELGIAQREAQAFIDAYFGTYRNIKGFIETTVRQAEREGGVRTMLGRYRPIPGINARNKVEKQAAERVAVNTPIQGSGADIVKLAMLRIAAALKREGLVSRMVLQVHDELILEVPVAERDRIMQLVKSEMEAAISLRVPLRANVESGASWGAMH